MLEYVLASGSSSACFDYSTNNLTTKHCLIITYREKYKAASTPARQKKEKIEKRVENN
jgi:hypothetical protein